MIPAELRERAQWVVWRYEERDGRRTKIPHQIDGARASSTDPATWTSFEQAQKVGGYQVVFVFSADDPFVGIDLDDCVDDAGNVHPDAKRIVDELHAYTELTPSRHGLHVLLRAGLNGSRNRTSKTDWGGEFECYSQGRFFTVTGKSITRWGIGPRQRELDALLERMFPANGIAPPDTPDPLPRVELDDEELLRRAGTFKNGAEFERLYAGDHSHASASEADLALCNLLAFACGPDSGKIDRLFRRSGLMRPKWDERHGAQTYGGLTIAKALEGRTEFHVPAAGTAIGDGGGPTALWLDDFLAKKTEMPPALIGDEEDVVLPVAGFAILGGKGGRGKTTLIVDGAFHLASGRDWLGFAVPRALNVLLIENEGPREMFRRKLEAKRRTWSHEIAGRIAIYTFDWGGFDLRSEDARARLRAFIEENKVDLVFGDPLDSCGFEGVGSPEDTRDFMALAKNVGLHRDLAFWFNHHPKKGEVEDELDSLSGAWGGRPDTVLTLDTLDENRARLGLPKTRWGKTGKRPALILSFDPETEGFEFIKEDVKEERDYAEEIAELLVEGKWLTEAEIAAKDKGGIGAGRPKVKDALESNPERFIAREGAEVGRSSKAHATVWGLA